MNRVRLCYRRYYRNILQDAIASIRNHPKEGRVKVVYQDDGY